MASARERSTRSPSRASDPMKAITRILPPPGGQRGPSAHGVGGRGHARHVGGRGGAERHGGVDARGVRGEQLPAGRLGGRLSSCASSWPRPSWSSSRRRRDPTRSDRRPSSRPPRRRCRVRSSGRTGGLRPAVAVLRRAALPLTFLLGDVPLVLPGDVRTRGRICPPLLVRGGARGPGNGGRDSQSATLARPGRPGVDPSVGITPPRCLGAGGDADHSSSTMRRSRRRNTAQPSARTTSDTPTRYDMDCHPGKRPS